MPAAANPIRIIITTIYTEPEVTAFLPARSNVQNQVTCGYISTKKLLFCPFAWYIWKTEKTCTHLYTYHALGYTKDLHGICSHSHPMYLSNCSQGIDKQASLCIRRYLLKCVKNYISATKGIKVCLMTTHLIKLINWWCRLPLQLWIPSPSKPAGHSHFDLDSCIFSKWIIKIKWN